MKLTGTPQQLALHPGMEKGDTGMVMNIRGVAVRHIKLHREYFTSRIMVGINKCQCGGWRVEEPLSAAVIVFVRCFLKVFTLSKKL